MPTDERKPKSLAEAAASLFGRKSKNEPEEAETTAKKPAAPAPESGKKFGPAPVPPRPAAPPPPPAVPEKYQRPDEAPAAPPPPPAPKVKIIAKHKVTEDDDLTKIALKYYGRAIKEYWMYIYEHNKEIIGSRPHIVRPGIVLEIPELTEELKNIPRR